MKLQLFIRKQSKTQLGLVGILTSYLDLDADTVKRFVFFGVKKDANQSQFTVRQKNDTFKSKFGDINLDDATPGYMMTQPIWCNYEDNTGKFFGGLLGVYKTQNLKNEKEVYRYIVTTAINDTADLLRGKSHGFFESTKAKLLCASPGNIELEFECLSSTSDIDPCKGDGLDKILLQPVWDHKGTKYKLNSLLTQNCFQKLSTYTIELAKHGKCTDGELELWAQHHGFGRLGSREQEYIDFLQFHYQNESPMLIKKDRLLTIDESNKCDEISKNFFRSIKS